VLDPAAGPVSGDPHRLEQVAWNLLSNAVKFTPKGGWIRVELRRINSHVELAVSDNGAGIASEFLPSLFERFRQADASPSRRHGGLGLGLSIVRHLVELHGGSVRAHSDGSGTGAVFQVHLPLSSVQLAREPVSMHPAAPSGDRVQCAADALRGVRVLAVDDDPDARELIARMLTECQATVETAGSAEEAIAALSARKPDVLISDIGMPETDGYALIRRVRSLNVDGAAAVPAIALTAFARSEDRTRALLEGFQAHVAKPVEPAELVAVIASLVGRTRPRPS
jgi:CheY-like chemotaxis protein